MFSPIKTKTLPGLADQKLFAAYKRTALSESLRGNTESALLNSLRVAPVASSTQRSGLVAKVITQADYPTIVELKLAGRSDAEIAKRFGVSLPIAASYIAQALSDYRKRKLRVRPDCVVNEARKVGEERASLENPASEVDQSMTLSMLV